MDKFGIWMGLTFINSIALTKAQSHKRACRAADRRDDWALISAINSTFKRNLDVAIIILV